MSILIGQYEFDGPVAAFSEIPEAPGLYAVLHKQNHDLLLVDIDQSNNLAQSLLPSALELPRKMVVLLPCENSVTRKEILHELLREFEFEDDEPTQTAATRRTETKAGVALTI
jgi:hypothetical protein